MPHERSDASAPGEPASNEVPAHEESGRILLVDDEQSFLEPTAEMLRRAGHLCSVAPDARQALDALDQKPFDVVLSDVRMPGNQQLEFVRQLCDQDDGPAVIVVTGFPSVESAVSSLDLRVFAYLVKPIEFDTLLEKVESAVRQIRIRRNVTVLEERLARIHEDVRSVAEVLRTPQPRIDQGSMERLVEGTNRALLEGLRDLGRLETDVQAGFQEATPAAPSSPAGVDLSVLSPRELEVLELIRNGYRVATVARRLFISPHTVRNHLKRIFLKLEVGSQAQLLEKLKPLIGE